MYLAFNAGNLGLNLAFDEAVRLAGKHGFGAIELDPLAVVERYGLRRAQDLCGQYGVMPSGCGLPVPVQADSPDYDQALAALPRYADAARALGIHRCSTWIMSWSDTLEFEENFEAHVRRIKPCAKILEDHGIDLGLEFLGPKTLYEGKHKFITTPKGMLELGAEMGTGNMGLLFDAYHAYAGGMDVADCLSDIEDERQIVLVHINDAKAGQPLETLPDTLRYLPGEGGGIDLKGFFKGLLKIGYTGPVVVEPFSQTLKAIGDPEEVVRVVKAAVDGVWLG